MTRHADEVTLRTTESERAVLKLLPGGIAPDVVADIESLLTLNAALAAKCERLEGALKNLLLVSLPQDVSGQRWIAEARAALAPQPEGDKT